MQQLSLVSLLLLSTVMVRAADLTRFLAQRPLAVTKVFIDSQVEARQDDVEYIVSVLPQLGAEPDDLFAILPRLYHERYCEKYGYGEPPVGIYDDHVDEEGRVVIFSTNTDFAPFLSALPLDEAGSWVFLPPGSLRDGVGDKICSNTDPANQANVYESFWSKMFRFSEKHKDNPVIPFKRTLKEKANVIEHILTAQVQQFDDQLKRLSSKNDLQYGTAATVSARITERTGSFLPFKLISEHVKEHYKRHDLEIAPNFIDELVCMLIADFWLPWPGHEHEVMKGLANDIEPMLRQATLVDSVEEYFSAVVCKVLEKNPEALPLDPDSLQMPAFERIVPVIAKTCLESYTCKFVHGIVKRRMKVDESMMKTLIDLIDDEWMRTHYHRILFNQRERVNLKSVTLSLYDPNGPQYCKDVNLPMDLVSKHLVPLSGRLSASTRNSPNCVTLSNHEIFFNILSESHSSLDIDVLVSAVLRGDAHGDLSEYDVKLAELFLHAVLPKEQYESIVVKTWVSTPEEWLLKRDVRKEPSHKQRCILNGLFFRQGAFKPKNTSNYFNALEAVATLFFPDYTSKLRTAVKELDGNLKIEDMFLCPFIDKGWLLEFYGNIHVKDKVNDPTYILRLCDGSNLKAQQELAKYIHHIFDAKEIKYELYDVRQRIADLIRFLGPSKVDTIVNLLEPLKVSKASVLRIMNGEALYTSIESEKIILLSYLTGFNSLLLEWNSEENLEGLDHDVKLYHKNHMKRKLEIILSFPEEAAVKLLKPWRLYMDAFFFSQILAKNPVVVEKLIIALAKEFAIKPESGQDYHMSLFGDMASGLDVSFKGQDMKLYRDLFRTKKKISHPVEFLFYCITSLSSRVRLLNKLFEEGLEKVVVSTFNWNKLLPMLGRSEEVSPRFAKFFLTHRLNEDGFDESEAKIWWKLYLKTGDVWTALKLLKRSTQSLLPSTDEHESKQVVETLPEQTPTSMTIIPRASELFSRSVPGIVRIYVDGVLFSVPSNAVFGHLYAAVRCHFGKTGPFKLVNVNTQAFVPPDALDDISCLNNVQLAIVVDDKQVIWDFVL